MGVGPDLTLKYRELYECLSRAEPIDGVTIRKLDATDDCIAHYRQCLVECYNDESICGWALSGNMFTGFDRARDIVLSTVEAYGTFSGTRFEIIHNGQRAGLFSLRAISCNKSITIWEIGYAVLPKHREQRVASNAVRLAVGLLDELDGTNLATARVNWVNSWSKVVLKRNGFNHVNTDIANVEIWHRGIGGA